MKLSLNYQKFLKAVMAAILAVGAFLAPVLSKRQRQAPPTVDTMAKDMVDHGMF